MERGRKRDRLRLREREWDGGGDREVGGGEDGDGRRGSGMFISVYKGSSCALLLGDSSNVRMGAEDSWVGVVDGDSGDMGHVIWLVDISCVVLCCVEYWAGSDSDERFSRVRAILGADLWQADAFDCFGAMAQPPLFAASWYCD
jgi:hypothetical protein